MKRLRSIWMIELVATLAVAIILLIIFSNWVWPIDEAMSDNRLHYKFFKSIVRYSSFGLMVLFSVITYLQKKKLQVNDNERFFSIIYLEKSLLAVILGSALLGGIFLGFIIYAVQEGKEDLNKIASFKPTLPTRLYDVNGDLISELFQHKRQLIHLEEIPKPVIAAFLSVEDQNFYSHFGIDFLGILRAAWANLKALKVVQGGSTLTQQLVKGLYTRGEKTFYRKLFEAILALKVEKEFSKDEILELYFNQIYLGHGTYGLSTAAKFYFNKRVSELNLIEGAILAALPKAPHKFSPFRSPHRSRRRNRIVLNQMVHEGHLTQAESDTMYQEYWPKYWQKIITTPPSKTSFGSKTNNAPYFTEFVRQELIGLFGEEAVYTKGLQVYTTLDLFQQVTSEKLMKKLLKKQDPIARAANRGHRSGVDYQLLSTFNLLKSVLRLPGIRRSYSRRADFRAKFKKKAADALELISLVVPALPVNKVSENFMQSTREFRSELHVQGAFLGMEPKTGRLTAMIGGREFKSSDQFNRATQARRQPGSSFKPFVYGAAIEDRVVHYGQGFSDSPLMTFSPDGTMWAPINYSGKFRGNVLLYKALAWSLNLISVQVYFKVGPDKIIDFASRLMKIPQSRFQPNPALSLGASEVTPKELLLGYSILTNGGKEIIPHAIIYVTDRDGNVIYNLENQIFQVLNYKKKNNQIQVIEPSVSFIMRRMMQNVVRHGTAATVRTRGGFKGDGAGKTGSTSSWNDSWFCGTTSDLAAVIWLGLDNGSMSLGRHQSGGGINAPVWGEFMQTVYKHRGSYPKKFSLKKPKGVRSGSVCKYTGKMYNPECDKTYELAGTMWAAPKKVGNTTKRVGLPRCDCEHVHSVNFFDLMQSQHHLSDDEIDKTKSFQGLYEGNH